MNAVGAKYDLPPDRQAALGRAKRVEWASVVSLLSIVLLMWLVMGNSQTMKAMWVEDTLSLIPTVSFLIGAYFRGRAPTEEYAYGYRRAVLVGFMCGAVALFGFGVYIALDSIMKLLAADHPTIPTVRVFGVHIWLGWIMLATLLYSVIPPIVLGRLKAPLAQELHDKTLHVSATIDKGDLLSGLAGAMGMLGIALGFWWADSVAAAFISIEIVRDGYQNLTNATAQLMDKRPSDIETGEKDPAIDRLQDALKQLDWVANARVRLREQGDILTGEAFIVPRRDTELLGRLDEARQLATGIDWRLHDVNIVLVRSVE